MLEEKIRLILNLIDVYDNELISKNEFEKFFTISCIQSSDNNININKICQKLFEKESFIRMDYAFTKSLKITSLRTFFREVLTDLFRKNNSL
jgi:hypothetical protein